MEPHDRCIFDGCTLGRGHVCKHVGPLCPNCGSASRWLTHRPGWWCSNDSCDYLAAIPVPAEPHDRCEVQGCTLGRAHVGDHVGPPCPNCGKPSGADGCTWRCQEGGCPFTSPIPVPAEPARQPMPAAAPVASLDEAGEFRGTPPTTADGLAALLRAAQAEGQKAILDQILFDLQAEATEHDEAARHRQRRAKDARDCAARILAWRSKVGL